MNEFTDLTSLYKHLEKNADIYKYPHQIGRLFQKIRDIAHKQENKEESDKAQLEVDFFNFIIREGTLSPNYSWTDKEGKIREYPVLNDKMYSYLIERVNSTYHPILKSRYSNILWCSPKKNVSYARIALDSYLKLVKIYEDKDAQENDNDYGLDVMNSIESAYAISCRIKYKLDKVKKEIKRLVAKFDHNSRSSFKLRHRIIRLMLEQKRIFVENDFLGIHKLCWNTAKSLTQSGDIHSAIDMLKLGIKTDLRTKRKTYNWIRRIAESYEVLMNQSDSLTAVSFCEKALSYYRQLKDKKKIAELEGKYSKLKAAMEFIEFGTDINLTEHIKTCRVIAANFAKEGSYEIISALVIDKSLLPLYKDMEKQVIEFSKKYPLQYDAPAKIVDASGHTAQYFSDDIERIYHGIIHHYQMELEMDRIHLINEIFFALIREEKINTKILLDFLIKHSWYGKDIIKNIPNNKSVTYNWINLLAPAIHDYFTQMQFWFVNPSTFPNLVLSIDSLTLKLEGLFRDFCRLSGVTTFYMTKDSKGRNIVREKDIHALLYENKIIEYFNEDDLLFFKFLLVEQAGYNLRHKIAHSLMLFQEYGIGYMHLLILALLRLGKYDFVKQEKKAK
jgi:hypothetical protein